MPNKKIINEVAHYYTKKLAQFGETPQGVDWNGKEGQISRFNQLCKIIIQEKGFSVNDLGCGYGALYDYMIDLYNQFSYTGFDIAKEMINVAQSRYSHCSNAQFFITTAPKKNADYGIASGIFNVRLEHNDTEWLQYIKKTLAILNETSDIGFSFNCLTSYSDKEKMRDYLYYADPCLLFDYCKQNFSHNVTLLHDYGLYEFTILVRKEI